MITFLLTVSLLLLSSTYGNILSTFDFIVNFAPTTIKMPANFAGISMSFSQIYNSTLNSTLFQSYLRNSWISDSAFAAWPIAIKMQWPVGYKYNCPSGYSSFAPNVTCVLNISSYMAPLGTFFRTTTLNFYGLSLGFDVQGANFSNTNFQTIFENYNGNFFNSAGYIDGGGVNIELHDQADQYAANNVRQNFTPSAFIAEASAAWWYVPENLVGPGITESADPSWLDSFQNFTEAGVGTFSVYSVPFKTTAELTIANILNESNYRDYIVRLFTSSNGVLNPANGDLAITSLQMTYGDGLNGVTNTMAAAIWAVDFLMECALFGLTNVLLNNNFTSTNMQYALGPAPTYAPGPMYYALLLMAMIQGNQPTFVIPNVVAGTSSSIKVYGLYSYPEMFYLIVNKDTNPNASGVVQLNVNSTEILECMYMSASSLTSANITLAGYNFNPSNSTPQGSYVLLNYTNTNNTYFVNLSYAQVAYCYIISPSLEFPKWNGTTLSLPHLTLLTGLIVLLFTI